MLFKCLSDDTRLKTCLLLTNHSELCVCELVIALDVIQPKISRHLAHLRKASILIDRKKGQWVYYSINADLPQWCKQIINTARLNNETFIKDCETRLKGMADRPPTGGWC